jgi:PIN domain
MVLGWFKSERRERRRKVRLDRQYLETRARRFLKNYLSADESRKPLFYRAVEDASIQCHQPVTSEIEDAQIAEATSRAAMQVVLQREERSAIEKADDQTADFVTDAYATVAIAYHRAAGIYTDDKKMQELGTAAVHLLTMATSYLKAQP